MDGSAFTDLVSSAVAGSGAALIADGLKLPKLSPAEHDRLKTQQIKAIMLASKLAEHHHTRLRASVKAMMELAGASDIGGNRHKRAVRAFGRAVRPHRRHHPAGRQPRRPRAEALQGGR